MNVSRPPSVGKSRMTAHKRHWFRLGLLVAAVLLAVALWKVPLIGSLTLRDIVAIRNVIATDPRTQGEPILSIDEGADRVAEVDIGEARNHPDATGRTVFLQKRDGVWKIVTFSKWSMPRDAGPATQFPQDSNSNSVPARTN